MQRCNDAGSVLGAPDGARSGLPARAPPSDPRRRDASQRTLRQIMQSARAPSQARGAPPCAQAMSGTVWSVSGRLALRISRAHLALARAANSVLGCALGARQRGTGVRRCFLCPLAACPVRVPAEAAERGARPTGTSFGRSDRQCACTAAPATGAPGITAKLRFKRACIPYGASPARAVDRSMTRCHAERSWSPSA